MLIEASITAGIRPTAMILHTQPRKPWNDFDFLCIEAHEIVLRERCPQCQLPRWMCHNTDGDVGFEIEEDVCFAIRELETLDEEATKRRGDEPAENGMKMRPVPMRYSGKPLDSALREAFYKAEYERMHPEGKPNVG